MGPRDEWFGAEEVEVEVAGQADEQEEEESNLLMARRPVAELRTRGEATMSFREAEDQMVMKEERTTTSRAHKPWCGDTGLAD